MRRNKFVKNQTNYSEQKQLGQERANLKKKVLVYVLFAFAISWSIAFYTYWLLEHKQKIKGSQIHLYHAFAALGPVLATVFTVLIFYGKDGLKKLLRKLHFPKGRFVLWLSVSPLLLFNLGVLLSALNSKAMTFKQLNLDFSAVTGWAFLPLLTYAIFEEMGWRGFLLAHLQEKYTAWRATNILTLIWAPWHIPFFFYRFDFSPIMGIGFFFGIWVGALILTSLYNASGGALLAVMLFHFLNNLCSIVGDEIILSILSLGYAFLAVFLYRKYGQVSLSKTEQRVGNYFEK